MNSSVTFKLLYTFIVWLYYSNVPKIIGHKYLRDTSKCECDTPIAPSGGRASVQIEKSDSLKRIGVGFIQINCSYPTYINMRNKNKHENRQFCQ